MSDDSIILKRREILRISMLAEDCAYSGEASGTPAPPDLEMLAAALGVELPKEEDEDEEEEFPTGRYDYTRPGPQL